MLNWGLKLTEIETTAFIGFFQTHDCLYNVSSSTYHNKKVRGAALRTIALRMAETFQKHMESEFSFYKFA